MSPQAVTKSKSTAYSGCNPENLERGVRQPKYSENIGCATLTRLIVMMTSSIPTCLMTRDLTYSRATTDTVATTLVSMVIVANAGALLRSPPAGGVSREAIAEFFGRAKSALEDS